MTRHQRIVSTVFLVSPITIAVLSFFFGKYFTVSPNTGFHHYIPQWKVMLAFAALHSLSALAIGLMFQKKFLVGRDFLVRNSTLGHFLWGYILYVIAGAISYMAYELLSGSVDGWSDLALLPVGGIVFGWAYASGITAVLGGAAGIVAARISGTAV